MKANTMSTIPLSASQTSPEISLRKRMAWKILKMPVASAHAQTKKMSTNAVVNGPRRVTTPAQIPTTPSNANSQGLLVLRRLMIAAIRENVPWGQRV
jgi:hypothetical protein